MTSQSRIAYYIDSDGPTLRIDVQGHDHLIAIRYLFGKLASGETLELDFGNALHCVLDNASVLITRSTHRRPSISLEISYQTSSGPAFSWSNTSDYWLDCAEKVDVLIEDGLPGHQYLTAEDLDDDIIIALSYLE